MNCDAFADDMHLVERFPAVGELLILVVDRLCERPLAAMVSGGGIDGYAFCPFIVAVAVTTCFAVDGQPRSSPGSKFSDDQQVSR